MRQHRVRQVFARACVLGLLVVLMLASAQAPAAAHLRMSQPPAAPDAGWDTLIGATGMNRGVYDLAVDRDGSVYAVGDFTTAGGRLTQHTARWDGQAWGPLGVGMNETVYAVAADGQGGVYVGGMFDTAIDQYTADDVAHWTGQRWERLAGGVDGLGRVNTLVMSGSMLYIGGAFHWVDGSNLEHVARWDGQQWHGYGWTPDGEIFALADNQRGTLYAGGNFLSIGQDRFEGTYVAQWNAALARWAALGNGTNGPVYALVMDGQSQLYTGGDFTQAGGVAANHVARWDGTRWEPLGEGMNGPVLAITVAPDGTVYAGGSFTQAGGQPANYIARWDGQRWTSVGQGTNNYVHALTVDARGVLYVGGDFTQAGGKPAHRIARWVGNVQPLSIRQFIPMTAR